MEEKELNLPNHEHISLWIAFANIEEALDKNDIDEAKALCQKWADAVRYSNIVESYTLMA